MELSEELKTQFKNAVGASAVEGLHDLDKRRFIAFFDTCWNTGIEVSPTLIDDNWPTSTAAKLGGDPAKSDKLIDAVYQLVAEWNRDR